MSISQKPLGRMRQAEFITLSAFTMMLTALGIDIMLPALGEIRRHFNLPHDSTAASNVIVFFFMGQVAQIVFGILSDRFGRLPILRIGFPLYIIGGIAATYAPNLQLMYLARFIAGVGSSAVFMTTIAGVRDRFVGDQMARMMSLILTIFLFTPIIAPFLGMAILSFSSWQMVFITPPLFGAVVFLWSLRLEESHPVELRTSLHWKTIGNSIRNVVSNKVFMRYTTITTLLFTALSSYVSSSEHMVGEIYKRPELFPWIFAAIGLGMSICSLVNAKLSVRFGAKRTMRSLLLVYTIVAAILLFFMVLQGDPPDMSIFFIAVGILMAVNLTIEPNSSALALEPMGQTAGIAASIYGTIFFFVGSSLGAVISHLMKHTIAPLAISFLIFGGTGFLLAKFDKTNSTA